MSTRNGRKSMHSARKRYAKKRTAGRRIVRDITIGVVATLAAIVALGACADTPAGDDDREVIILQDGYDGDDEGRHIMTQDDFPCNEDEVLTYDPSFGPDHVGCINRENIN